MMSQKQGANVAWRGSNVKIVIDGELVGLVGIVFVFLMIGIYELWENW